MLSESYTQKRTIRSNIYIGKLKLEQNIEIFEIEAIFDCLSRLNRMH